MEADTQDFDSYVLARSKRVPVLVDFWAPWCGPCKMLGPIIERLAAEANGKWVLVKINTEEQPELAQRFQIRGIPNLKLFFRGEVIAELAGALPEPQLRAWLAQHLPSPKRETMAKARELLHNGNSVKATRLLQPTLETDPQDSELAALTARALVFREPAQAIALIAQQPGGSPWEDAIFVVNTFATLFSLLDSPTAEVTASPLGQTYLGAIRFLKNEHFTDALHDFIAVLESKSTYDNGRAKAACLAVFKHLGMRHPTTEEFWRRFSSSVNV